MPPKGDPVPRARAALHWLSGLLMLGILAGLVITAAAALWQNVDINSLARRAAAVIDEPPELTTERGGPSAYLPGRVRVALYANVATEAFFPDSTHLPGVLADWSRELSASGWDIERIGSRAELDALPPATLVVAPEAVCLSGAEIEALFRHLRRGGGVVANWALGARDGNCEWRGWETLRDFTGAIDVVEYQAGDELYVTVPASLGVSAGLAPGSRIEFYADSHLGLLVPGPRVYWSDWALNSSSSGGESAADGALALRTTAEGGRAVWLGFKPGQAIRPLDQARASRLLQNTLRWAAGVPAAAVAAWPEGRRAGLMVAEDVESGFVNATSLARVLRERGIKGTFFLVSEMALDHPEIADSLADVGEIGSHTADHVPTVGLPQREQRIRLERSRRELESWSGQPVLGLRPPEERFDEATLRAWLSSSPDRAGAAYVAAVNGARSAAPEVFRFPEGSIVVLPRLMKDDYNVVVQEGTSRPERLTSAYLEGLRKLGALGGLGFVSLHSQIAATPGRIGVVETVLDSIADQRGTWWIATGSEIARWWLDREAMSLSLRPAAEGDDLELVVEAPIGSSYREVWIDVTLPGDDRIPFEGERQLPYAPSEWGIQFPLRPLAAGELRTIRLVRGVGVQPGDPAP
ncbi:MAG: polysaccharide deacetylase family protein [Gemmatimonadota bacterium]|nr:polysaccharide deacetylase family protein [Gemmatimonadota bacterium]MDH3427109.1 polysaccharide deacetylase family protein [Gemmatimonadota bacterium]